jgi:phosphoadenosine phosphosulfate reductase
MTTNPQTLAYSILNEEDYAELNKELEGTDTLGVLKWAYGHFGDDLVYACSFGAEGMVLIDMISKVKPDAHIVFLDTHVHYRETYALIERVQELYPQLHIEKVQPELSLTEQAEQYGPRLWEREPNTCCRLRKLEPLQKALSGYSAWLSGLRRDQSPTRAHTQYVNQDDKFQSIKICPLIHWTWDDIWMYINARNLPYNPLHDQGYPSIGCEPCTFAVQEGADMRSGRWKGTSKTECGLHGR